MPIFEIKTNAKAPEHSRPSLPSLVVPVDADTIRQPKLPVMPRKSSPTQEREVRIGIRVEPEVEKTLDLPKKRMLEEMFNNSFILATSGPNKDLGKQLVANPREFIVTDNFNEALKSFAKSRGIAGMSESDLRALVPNFKNASAFTITLSAVDEHSPTKKLLESNTFLSFSKVLNQPDGGARLTFQVIKALVESEQSTKPNPQNLDLEKVIQAEAVTRYTKLVKDIEPTAKISKLGAESLKDFKSVLSEEKANLKKMK